MFSKHCSSQHLKCCDWTILCPLEQKAHHCGFLGALRHSTASAVKFGKRNIVLSAMSQFNKKCALICSTIAKKAKHNWNCANDVKMENWECSSVEAKEMGAMVHILPHGHQHWQWTQNWILICSATGLLHDYECVVIKDTLCKMGFVIGQGAILTDSLMFGHQQITHLTTERSLWFVFSLIFLLMCDITFAADVSQVNLKLSWNKRECQHPNHKCFSKQWMQMSSHCRSFQRCNCVCLVVWCVEVKATILVCFCPNQLFVFFLTLLVLLLTGGQRLFLVGCLCIRHVWQALKKLSAF